MISRQLDNGDAVYYKAIADYPNEKSKVDSLMEKWESENLEPMAIKGLENASTYPNLLIELSRRGWTEAALKKITSENFLRVFEEVEKKAGLLYPGK